MPSGVVPGTPLGPGTLCPAPTGCPPCSASRHGGGPLSWVTSASPGQSLPVQLPPTALPTPGTRPGNTCGTPPGGRLPNSLLELPRPTKGQPSGLSLRRAAPREHSTGGARPAGKRPVLRRWAACCVPTASGPAGDPAHGGAAVGTHTRITGLRTVPAHRTAHSVHGSRQLTA